VNRCGDDRLVRHENSICGNMTVVKHRMPDFELQAAQMSDVEHNRRQGH
jgi:hypothetical protein